VVERAATEGKEGDTGDAGNNKRGVIRGMISQL
jgi:hypothetical protein